VGRKALKKFIPTQNELFSNKVGWYLVCEDDAFAKSQKIPPTYILCLIDFKYTAESSIFS